MSLPHATSYQARRNRSGRSGHGPTKISAKHTFFLRCYRCSGADKLLERGLKRSPNRSRDVRPCLHADRPE